MSVKKQLLDPLGSFCKLIALNFNEINTKISIHKHSLSLDPPNNYQFITRYINGDGRENVSELFYVVIRVIKWYLVVDEDMSNDENWMQIAKSEEMKRLAVYACNALKKLQETYEYGNVVLATQFYINVLDDAVNGQYNDNKLPRYIFEKEKEYENLLDYSKLRNFWDYKKLKIVCGLYDDSFNVYYDPEMPSVQKEAFIEGYLRSIYAILELADNDFQKLIQNSSKG